MSDGGSGGDADSERPTQGWLERRLPMIVTMLIAFLLFTVALRLYPSIPLVSDAFGYTSAAWRLVSQGFLSYGGGKPDAYVTPVYPLFLAGFYWFARNGQSFADAVRAVHPFILAAQLLLAVATVGLVAECGVALGGALLGLTAGTLAALYLPFGWASSMALSESLGVFLVALQLLIALNIVDSRRLPSRWEFVCFGIVSGLVGLTRPAYVLWALVPIVWLFIRRGQPFARLAQWGAFALLGFVLLLFPWWARNAIVLNRLIPLSASSGEARLAAAGGYPLTSAEKALRADAEQAGRDGAGAVADARIEAQWEASPQRFLISRFRGTVASVVLPFIAPETYIHLERIGAIGDDSRIDFGPRMTGELPSLPRSTITTFYQWALLLLAALGVLSSRKWPRLVLVASVPLYAVLVHAPILIMPRYFFPAMPAVILLAATGLQNAVFLIRDRRTAVPGHAPVPDASEPGEPRPSMPGAAGLEDTANRDVCVVVPVFNEGTVVRSVVDEILTQFCRVVVVDDGSTDGSSELLRATSAILVRHPVNLGQGAALQTGIEAGLRDPEVEYFVTFDSDGQHRVSDAVSMVRALRGGEVDVVLGSRFLGDSSGIPLSKRLSLGLVRWLMNLTTGMRLTDAHNGLRAFNRRFARSLHLQENGMAHASEIVSQVARGSFDYREWPVQIAYTAYSVGKGQPLMNGVNILFDMIFDASRRK